MYFLIMVIFLYNFISFQLVLLFSKVYISFFILVNFFFFISSFSLVLVNNNNLDEHHYFLGLFGSVFVFGSFGSYF